jgi:excisionase family DNA binding protein
MKAIMPFHDGEAKLIVEQLTRIARTIAPAELPEVIGAVEMVKAVAWARLQSPSPVGASEDRLLNVDEAAEQLGVSTKYLYQNHERLPFTRRMGRSLRFSASGICAYIQRHPAGSREVHKSSRVIR